MSFRAVAIAASLALLSPAFVTDAFAACTRLAFSVNDYGKDGPTKDAKNLLDKYIKTWTSERGIKTYTVGPKDVSCELFLNLILFDEHTCKASALVCWNGPRPADPVNASLPSGASATSAGEGTAPPKKSVPPRPAQSKATTDTSPIATGSVEPAKAPARAPAPPKEAPAAEPAPPPLPRNLPTAPASQD